MKKITKYKVTVKKRGRVIVETEFDDEQEARSFADYCKAPGLIRASVKKVMYKPE